LQINVLQDLFLADRTNGRGSRLCNSWLWKT